MQAYIKKGRQAPAPWIVVVIGRKGPVISYFCLTYSSAKRALLHERNASPPTIDDPELQPGGQWWKYHLGN